MGHGLLQFGFPLRIRKGRMFIFRSFGGEGKLLVVYFTRIMSADRHGYLTLARSPLELFHPMALFLG